MGPLQLGIQACGRPFCGPPPPSTYTHNITLTPSGRPHPLQSPKRLPPQPPAIFPGRKSRLGSRALPNSSLPWCSSPAPFGLGKGKCQAWQGDGGGWGGQGPQGTRCSLEPASLGFQDNL